jgi:hypothetical protein
VLEVWNSSCLTLDSVPSPAGSARTAAAYACSPANGEAALRLREQERGHGLGRFDFARNAVALGTAAAPLVCWWRRPSRLRAAAVMDPRGWSRTGGARVLCDAIQPSVTNWAKSFSWMLRARRIAATSRPGARFSSACGALASPDSRARPRAV